MNYFQTVGKAVGDYLATLQLFFNNLRDSVTAGVNASTVLKEGGSVNIQLRNGDFRARLERESMPLNAIYTNRVGTYAVNTNLLGNNPGPTASWWLDNVQITANESCVLAAQIGGSFNPAIGWYMPYIITPGTIVTIPINAFIVENSGITLTMLSSSSNTNFQITAAVQGKIVSSDFLRDDAEYILLEIGDSIGSGSGVSSTEQNYNYKLRDALEIATGKRWRVIRKSMGSMTSSHMESLRLSGKLDVIQPHVIVYNMGMNNSSAATYTTDLNTMTTYLQTRYPKALKIICGPTLRTDSQESVLVGIRSAAQTRVANLNLSDNRFVYSNLGNLPPWTTANHTSTYATDGTHPIPAGHTLMFNKIWQDVFLANDNYWINYLLSF